MNATQARPMRARPVTLSPHPTPQRPRPVMTRPMPQRPVRRPAPRPDARTRREQRLIAQNTKTRVEWDMFDILRDPPIPFHELKR